MINQDFL